MRIQLNIEKKHLYLGVLVLALFGISFVFALSADKIPWHALQQVSTASTGTTSVDANDNKVIDDSDKLNGFPPSFYKDADKIRSKQVFWREDKLCYYPDSTCNSGVTSTCNGRTDTIGNVDIECADDVTGVQYNAAEICRQYTVSGCDSDCQAVKYYTGIWETCQKKPLGPSASDGFIYLGTLKCTSRTQVYLLPGAPKCATFQ